MDEYGKWVDARERLPEQGELVLCCGPHGGLFIGSDLHKNESWLNGEVKYFAWNQCRVTKTVEYWMPLPLPKRRNKR